MNTKKIAGLIRRLSSYDLTGLPFTSRCMSEILEELANEIEPQPTEETKPEPAYKVGDWVEYNGCFGRHIGIIDAVSPGGSKVHIYVSDTHGLRVDISCLRKLSPSEVRIKVTLEGTVKLNGEDCEHFLLKHSPGRASTIRFDALDPATRSLVKNLLKEEK